jgi:glycerol-3-phosphate acyltransferase PlsY
VAVALVALGYVCGSIPWGVLLARTAGVDVRKTGSGNIGAANVARSAGLRLGLATLAADATKGVVPIVVARAAGASPEVAAVAGLAAFAGHVFPVTLRLRGGKGVATALGVVATLAPAAALSATAVFAVALATSRYVSLASVLGALTAPAVAAALGYGFPAVAACLAMAIVIVVRHEANFRRLVGGTEPRFKLHKGQATPSR